MSVCSSWIFPYVLSRILEVGNQRYAWFSLGFKVRKGPSGLKTPTRRGSPLVPLLPASSHEVHGCLVLTGEIELGCAELRAFTSQGHCYVE